ncbi:Hypothetical protein, putative [Bodo saltans]|uniref:Uncharacterized protein n=1 Tax=Bodo saltans TaxID=75058 RepID=A0A0S4J905_BODSA|nr:Hypothetical protein, putative [Bodo saltans]|eukprot:CUG86430.1 Hypothetical protein, putative [Bodo saltans]
MGNACTVGDVIVKSSPPQLLTPRSSRGTPPGQPTASTIGPSTEQRSPPTQRRAILSPNTTGIDNGGSREELSSASRRVTVEDSITMVVAAPPLMTSSPRQGLIPPQSDRAKGTVEGTSKTTFDFDEKVQTSVPRQPQPPSAVAAATTRVANNFRAALANSLPSTPQSNPLARSCASPATSRGGWSSVVSPPPALDLRSALIRGTSSHEHDDEVFEDPSAFDRFDASPLGASPRTTTTSHHTSSAIGSPRLESCESTSNRPLRVSFRSYAVVMGEEGDEDQPTSPRSPPLKSVATIEPTAVDPTTVIMVPQTHYPNSSTKPSVPPASPQLRGGHSSSAHNVSSMNSVLMTSLWSSSCQQPDMDSFFGEVGIAPSTASMLVSLPPPSPQRHQIARKKLPHSHHHQGHQQQRTAQASPPASYHNSNINNLSMPSSMIPRHLGSVETQPLPPHQQDHHMEQQQQMQRTVSQLNNSASISQHASTDDVTLFMKLSTSSASVSGVAAGGDVPTSASPISHHNHSNDDLSTAAVQID